MASLAAGALAVSGCGSSASTTTQTTSTSTTPESSLASVGGVEACLERAGFKVSHGNGAAPRELNSHVTRGWPSVWSDVALGEGSDRSTAFLGSAGRGEVTVQVYSNVASAQRAAKKAVEAGRRALRISSLATPESEGVRVGARQNVVWVAWGAPSSGVMSEQVAACA